MMLSGPKEIKSSLFNTISRICANKEEKEEKGVNREQLVLEAIQKHLRHYKSEEALDLTEPFLFEDAEIDILQLACRHGWNQVVIELFEQASPSKNKNPKVKINTSRPESLIEEARKYGHENIILSIGSLLELSTDEISFEPKRKVGTFSNEFEEELDFEEPSDFDPVIAAFSKPGKSNLNAVLEQTKKLSQQKNSHLRPMPPVQYGAAQGGGAKGATYIGTIMAMDQTGYLGDLNIVAGASAGAINAFMMGMGLNGDQIEEMSRQLNFQDFQDVVYSKYGIYAGGFKGIQATGIFTEGYIHSGENFFNWAQSLLEHVTGDPHITFAEYEKLCKENPALKEMIFKGFSYTAHTEGQTQEFTFSAKTTPNVLVIDALRASMSFPTAFKPWEVREKDPKDNNKIKPIGTFADGGMGNNFPIDVFNQKAYEDPHYPLEETTHKSSQTPIQRNPCSVGLSLCDLPNLDPEITPFTDRIIALKSKQKIESKKSEKKKGDSPRKSTLSDMFYGIRLTTFGQMTTPENMQVKYDLHKGQVVQVYTAGVGTLEFNLSKKKQKEAETSGYDAWLKWEEKFRDPSLCYGDEKEPQIKISLGHEEEELLAFFTYHFSALLQEAEAKKHHPNKAFRDLNRNQRMKYHSYMIQQGIKLANKIDKVDLETLLDAAHQTVVTQHQAKINAKKAHKQHLDTFITPNKKISTLEKLIKSKDHTHHLKALRLFCGSMSNALDLVARNGQLLSLATQSGDAVLLQGMLTHLKDNWNMMYQQERKPSFTLENIINDTSKVSLYKYAFQSDNYREMIGVLLAGGADPFKLDKHGKNAFHYAIDQINEGHVDTSILEFLIKEVETKQEQIAISSMHFGNDGDTLGHYIIKNASAETLKKLINNPNLLKKLISPYASNYDDVNCQELAAHHSQVLLDGKETHVDMFASILVSEEKEQPSTLAHQDDPEMMLLRNSCAMIHDKKQPKSKEEWQSYIKTHAPGYQKAKTEALMLKNALHAAITSGNLKNLDPIISNLSPEQCLLLLGSTNILNPKNESKLSFIFECAQSKDPAIQKASAKAVELLCANIYAYKGKQPQFHQAMLDLLSGKFKQKSPIYDAALADNASLIKVLRAYDISVNHAGPIDCPSALTAAAKAGSCKAVSAIMESKPYLGFASGYKTIERGKAADFQGKTLFHHLLSPLKDENENIIPIDPEAVATAFYDALNTGAASKQTLTIGNTLHKYTGVLDSSGTSCFRYLMQHPQAIEILKALQSKSKWWYLHTYFDLETKRSDGYTDLEWALKNYPEIANAVMKALDEGKTYGSSYSRTTAPNYYHGFEIAQEAQQTLEKERILEEKLQAQLNENVEYGEDEEGVSLEKEVSQKKPVMAHHYSLKNKKKDESSSEKPQPPEKGKSNSPDKKPY